MELLRPRVLQNVKYKGKGKVRKKVSWVTLNMMIQSGEMVKCVGGRGTTSSV